MVRVFVFDQIASAHPSWILAVWAVNPIDARRKVSLAYGGGHLVYEARPGEKIQANCGMTTDAAQEEIHLEYERWLNL